MIVVVDEIGISAKTVLEFTGGVDGRCLALGVFKGDPGS
jgi:hypothetical protein